jgi:formate-dependent nitrite reductase membrane component NrfD
MLDPVAERQASTPYGRTGTVLPAAGTQRPYQGENYYEQPALKPGHYRWLIVTYLWLGGMSGAAALLAAVADLAGSPADQVVVRYGRYLALLGASVGPILLILDLHTPQRFVNMLRIFRRTSPMSIGSWTLVTFGTLSGLAAAAQPLHDFAGWEAAIGFGTIVGVLAGLAGMVMACYTGTLLAATSVPLWAAIPRLLAALFATSSVSLAAAALILLTKLAGAAASVTRRLEVLDLIAIAVELVLLILAHAQWRRRGLTCPLRRLPLAAIYVGGVVLVGIALPVAIYLFLLLGNQSMTAATVTAAVAGLVGGYLLRLVVLFGGRASAQSAGDYFRFTQPKPGADGTAAGASLQGTADGNHRS